MLVLVTFGSTRGGTAGLAEMIAQALTDHGLTVELHPAQHVCTLDGYDAVIVAGALYMNRWHRHARRFVRRHEAALQDRPVWFVSSGPLDDTAELVTLAPVPQVRRLMDRVGARGHVTFGGRLSPDAKGFPARSMARDMAGDWRDTTHIRMWAAGVAAGLDTHPVG